jgi:hypothetical protein
MFLSPPFLWGDGGVKGKIMIPMTLALPSSITMGEGNSWAELILNFFLRELRG